MLKFFNWSGTHSPCIHDAIPQISRSVKMKVSADGKLVLFTCKTQEESRYAVNTINSKLGYFGYHAHYKDNLVIFQTSEFTSLEQLISKFGYRILYCEHDSKTEKNCFCRWNN